MENVGVFHEKRFEIVEELHGKIKTGDIFFRHSDVKFHGIPFSYLVCKLSKSIFSHASLAYVQDDHVWLIEVNELGCVETRLIDWISTCQGSAIAIYRAIKKPEDFKEKMEEAILEFLEKDPDYDFNFSNPDKFYCTESIAWFYNKIGIEIVKPTLIKDILPFYFYIPFFCINFIVKKLTSAGLATNLPLYFVGNKNQGFISSNKIHCIYQINKEDLKSIKLE